MEYENITNAPDNTVEDVCPECEPPALPKKGFHGFLHKLKKLSWKAWLIIAVLVAILISGGHFLYDRLTNTYATPLDRYMDYMNSRDYSMDAEIAMLNGFAEDEFNLLSICMQSSGNYLEKRENEFEATVNRLEDTCGKDYKFYYRIDRKSKLERDEINDFEDGLKYAAAIIKESLMRFHDSELLLEPYDLNEDKLELFAVANDMSIFQAKLYISALKSLRKELKSVEVTEGYELTVTIILKGSKLDEPKEFEPTKYVVYKVNGRWICPEFLENIFDFMQ